MVCSAFSGKPFKCHNLTHSEKSFNEDYTLSLKQIKLEESRSIDDKEWSLNLNQVEKFKIQSILAQGYERASEIALCTNGFLWAKDISCRYRGAQTTGP